MINYTDTFKRLGLSKLCKKIGEVSNLSELNIKLSSLGVSDTVKVRVLKELFDLNLPKDYKDLIPSSGMCGYWGIVYKYFFDLLGFNATLLQIDSKGRRFHHIIVRVNLHSSLVDMSRGSFCAGSGGTSDYLESWLDRIERENGNSSFTLIDNTTGLYDNFSLYSAVSFSELALEQLLNYTRYICKLNVVEFKCLPLSACCNSDLLYRVLTGVATLDERKQIATELYRIHKPIRD